MPLNVVLVEPEIPPNTGNIVRTCAATGCILHLVEPLGFDIDEKTIKRAGLDYWDKVDIRVHSSWSEFRKTLHGHRAWFFSTKACATYSETAFADGDYLVFGKETQGLDEEILNEFNDNTVRLPMLPGIRSLNLSNTVAVVIYEALRQQGFTGFEMSGKNRYKQEG